MKRISLLASLLAVSWLPIPAWISAPAHALTPHTVTLDFEELEQRGLELAQEAAQLAQFQQYPLALQRAELATQLVPGDYRLWALVADIHLRTQETEAAIVALQKARSIEPNEATLLFALGSAYFRQQDYDQAIESLESGLSLEPGVPGALFDLGNVYYVQQNYTAALATYDTALEAKEDFWEAINNIGLVQYEQGDATAALESWQRAIDINGEAVEPQLAVAVAHYAQGDRAAAVAQAIDALTADSRYGDVEFLAEQLWGDRLLADTAVLLAVPQVREAWIQAQDRQEGL